MLTVVLAHAGLPPAPHDVWGAWNADPLLLAGLAAVAALYGRGRARRAGSASTGRGARRRTAAFGAGMAVLVVALVSPLDALSGALASAHMVQHVLVVLVAAPLLILAAPGATLLHGLPLRAARAVATARRRLRLTPGRLRVLWHPAVVWLLHVVVLWVWHSAALYEAALRSGPVHALEHGSFLVTALLLWRVVLRPRGVVSPRYGLSVLLVFGAAMQSVLLSLLMTFAREPWYPSYTATAPAFGLDALADQRLAGVIMWVPAGFVYAGTALLLLAALLRDTASTRPAS